MSNKVNSVLIYNDDCLFCRDLAFWLQSQIGSHILEIAPNDKFLGWNVLFLIPEEDYKKDVHLISYNGHFYSAKSRGEAIIEAFKLAPEKFKHIVWAYENIWLFKKTFNFGYILLKKSKGYINEMFYE